MNFSKEHIPCQALCSWLNIACGILAGDVLFADEWSQPAAMVRMAISAHSCCWSKHTLTALCPGQGKPFEIQVRLWRMHLCSYITVRSLPSVRYMKWDFRGCFALCLLVRLGGPLSENNNYWSWLKKCNILPIEKKPTYISLLKLSFQL